MNGFRGHCGIRSQGSPMPSWGPGFLTRTSQLGPSFHGVPQTCVGLQYVQSLTTPYFSTPLRNSLYTQAVHGIVPSLPASLNFLLQQQPDPWATAKIRAKCRLELLLLEAGPDSQGGQCAQRRIHSSLENLHSPRGLLCWCLTLLTVPFLILYVQFECPLLFSRPGKASIPVSPHSWGGAPTHLSSPHRKFSFLCAFPEMRHNSVVSAAPVPPPGERSPSQTGQSFQSVQIPLGDLLCAFLSTGVRPTPL